jgi:hypothetical protein
MPVQFKSHHPALKHGGYASTALLPGESAADFKKLHQDLIAEFPPEGALEDDFVASMARLLWRKQNHPTFRIAERARRRRQQLINEKLPRDEAPLLEFVKQVDPAVREEATRAAEDQVRKEFGDRYELVEIGETATVDALMKDLAVLDRLDSLIDRCLKRLLFVRGLKSISASPSSAPPKRLQGAPRTHRI